MIVPKLAQKYNPQAYVPGYASKKVATDIQNQGYSTIFKKRASTVQPPVHATGQSLDAPAPPLSLQGLQFPTYTPFNPNSVARVNPMDIFNNVSKSYQGMVDPLLALLGTQRTAAEDRANTVGEQHAAALRQGLQEGAGEISGAYGRAVSDSGASAAAVANALGNAGSAASSDLAQRLALAGAGTQGAEDLSSLYKNAAASGYASNLADTDRLRSQQASAESYQAKLPGIATLTANQDVQAAMRDIAKNYREAQNTALDASQQQVGNMFSSLLEAANQARAEEIATGQSLTDAGYQNAQGKFEYAVNALKDKQSQADADREFKYKQSQDRAAALSAAEDRYLKNKLSIRALAASAITKADERKFKADEAANERQWKADQAAIARQFKAEHPTPTQPKSLVQVGSDATGRWLVDPVTGEKITKVSDPVKKPASSSSTDNWKTPGSAKRDRIVGSTLSAVINPETGMIRDTLAFTGNPDMAIYRAVTSAMKSQGLKPELDNDARILRAAIFERLDGKRIPYMEDGKRKIGTFTKPKFIGTKIK